MGLAKDGEESVRKVEYLFRLGRSSYILVTSNPKSNYFNSFKLYKGSFRRMKNLPILRLDRYLDGGTTIIRTSQGKLFCPPTLHKDALATWDDAQLTKLDPDRYVITEEESFASLRRK